MQSTPMATSSPQSPHLLRRPQRIASTIAHTEIPRRATIASSAKLEVVGGGIKEEETLESNCWRSDHRTLRAEIRGLRSEVAQLRMQDSLEVPELQRLVDGVLRDLNLDSDEDEEEEELGIVLAADWGQQEWDSGNAVEEQFRGSIISPIPHSEEVYVKQKEEGLSTGRRLKKLNVHDYVHGALRESHMRTWLQNRGIAE